jgi:hypothetical protein
MKQGKTEKAVFAKLASQKVELASVNELKSLTSKAAQEGKDFKSLASKGEVLSKDFDKIARRYHTAYMELNDLVEDLRNAVGRSPKNTMELDGAIAEFERKAKELGIDTPKELREAKQTYSQNFESYEEASDVWQMLIDLQSKYKFPF